MQHSATTDAHCQNFHINHNTLLLLFISFVDIAIAKDLLSCLSSATSAIFHITSHHTHQHSDMYRLFSTAGVIAMTSYTATAWTSTTMPQRRATTLPSTPDASNPCWQDNYDSEDDCLSTIYSASFVAEEWIKSMPCGKVCLQYYTAFILVLIHFCFIRTSHLSLRNL